MKSAVGILKDSKKNIRFFYSINLFNPVNSINHIYPQSGVFFPNSKFFYMLSALLSATRNPLFYHAANTCYNIVKRGTPGKDALNSHLF